MQENTIIKYTMTYGLYLGLAFSAIVIILKFTGSIHYPGDTAGIINTVILSFGMIVFGKKYRDTIHEGVFLYKNALKLLIFLALFSALIYGFFSYWYYAVLEPNGISSYVEQMRLVYSQNPSLSEEQINGLIALYESTITPGMMAFIVFFTQSLMGAFVALIMANFVKSPVKIEH